MANSPYQNVAGLNGPNYGAAQSAPVLSRHITHIEIRRVMNGFVVMGHDFRDNGYDASIQRHRRIAWVCESPQKLASLIESLTTDESGFVWDAYADLPMSEMCKIESK